MTSAIRAGTLIDGHGQDPVRDAVVVVEATIRSPTSREERIPPVVKDGAVAENRIA